jgi:hypothetical protein
MKKIILLFTILISSISFGQKNYKEVIAETVKNYNFNKIDSLARSIGYKGGETVKTFVTFKVNHKGETFDVSAKGPNKIFIDEGIKIVNSFSKLEFKIKLKKGQHFMFTLPIKFNIESERSYKRRRKKERRKKKN